MVLQDRDYFDGDGTKQPKEQAALFNIPGYAWILAAVVLVAVVLAIRLRDAPGTDYAPNALFQTGSTGTSPSAIPAPTDIERVRVSMYGVRIIPCSSADLYEGEPVPSLCLYAENGHVSQAHPAPTVAPQ